MRNAGNNDKQKAAGFYAGGHMLVKKTTLKLCSLYLFRERKRVAMRLTSIYSHSAELGANTIDPDKLNCRVRNGNGCCLVGINISLIPTPLFRRGKAYSPLPRDVSARCGKNENRFAFD